MKKFIFFLNICLICFFLTYFYYILDNYNKIYFSITRIIIFFIIPIIFLLINFIIFNFFKKNIINLILFQSSILVSLLILETFIQILPNIKNFLYVKEIKQINDGKINTNSLLDHYSKIIKGNNNKIYFPVYSANNQETISIDKQKLLALGGIANKQIIFCNEAGKWIEYTSDELGFRNPKGIWRNKEIDIFILGDSYGQGTCVENDKMIDYYIRQVYPNTLNLSYSMGGALIQLANLVEFGDIKKPNKVLHLYYSNDIPDTERENNNNILSNYKNFYKQNLYKNRKEINHKLIEKSKKIHKMYLDGKIKPTETTFGSKEFSFLQLIKLTNLRNFIGIPSLFEMQKRLNLELYFNTVLKSKKITETWNGEFIFVYLPNYNELSGFSFVNTSSDLIYEEIINFLNKNKINYIDFRKIYIDRNLSSDDVYRYNGSHYNEFGYEVIGKEIISYLNYND